MKPATWCSYEDRIQRVTAYIYDHLDTELSFETLSGVAALSPYHWHRVYHAMRGETVTATVKRLRLQRAAADLAQTPRSIDEVATRAGYGSVPAFTRAFAEAYGLPPATYRENGSHADFQPGRLDGPRARWRIDVRHAPVMQALAVAHSGSFMEIGRSFELLFGQAARQNLMPERVRMFGVYLDDPTLIAEDKLRAKATLIATARTPTSPPLESITIAGGDYAVLRHKGPFADMRAAYLWLFGTWLPQSGREAADAPVLEEYLNSPRDTPPTELLTDLYLPLA